MVKEISMLGIKMDLGKERRGADYAPSTIRGDGLFKALKSSLVNIKDLGDISSRVSDQLNENIHCHIDKNEMVSDFESIAETVEQIVAANNFPLVIGGDHSISIGTIAGIAKHHENLGIIWYDAHADVNTPLTTITGSIYGMALATNLGLGDQSLVRISDYTPKLKPENIVLIGTRELDYEEKEFLVSNRIKVFSVDDIHKIGIEEVMKEALKGLQAKCDGIHLSFDLDAIDPKDAPGVRTPSEEGLSFNESILAMRILHYSQLISSAEFTELNPTLDYQNKTSKITTSLIKALIIGK